MTLDSETKTILTIGGDQSFGYIDDTVTYVPPSLVNDSNSINFAMPEDKTALLFSSGEGLQADSSSSEPDGKFNPTDYDENGESLNEFSWKRAKKAILSTMKQNLVPGIILNVVCLIVLVGYYSIEPIETFLNRLGNLKEEYGLIYSFISTATFGGIIPLCVLIATGPERFRTARWICIRLPWVIAFWGLRGIELDSFYRFQSYLFGNNNNWDTILYKTLVDELIYAPFYTSIYVSFMSLLEMNDFAFKKTLHETILSRKWWINTWCVFNIAAWMVWTPISIIIYALPSALQITLLNLVVVFWVLCIRLLTASKNPETQNTSSEGLLDSQIESSELSLLSKADSAI